jgi:hypothetical protein
MKPTLCPKCGAENSLTQEVELVPKARREVRVSFPTAGPAAIDYGPLESEDGFPIQSAASIECTRCHEKWEGADDLREGKAHEYRCDSCDWWGSAEFQHRLERPDCDGALSSRGAFVA